MLAPIARPVLGAVLAAVTTIGALGCSEVRNMDAATSSALIAADSIAIVAGGSVAVAAEGRASRVDIAAKIRADLFTPALSAFPVGTGVLFNLHVERPLVSWTNG